LIQEDINNSKPCDTENCVVATSLKRCGYSLVEVMINRTYIDKTAYWHSPELIEYIKAFDNKEKIEPAQFIIYHIDDRLNSPKLGRPKK
jgi:hypothetical protein